MTTTHAESSLQDEICQGLADEIDAAEEMFRHALAVCQVVRSAVTDEAFRFAAERVQRAWHAWDQQ